LKEIIEYRLRHKTTGLYSTGGYDPKFNEKGKVWGKLQHLKSHLAQFKDSRFYPNQHNPTYLAQVEIVKLVYTLVQESVIPF
jgi:hypothetical protein